jgi:hypothetical protein
VKKTLIAIVLALSSSLAAPSAGAAGWFRQRPQQQKADQPKGGHTKGARGSTQGKHQIADGRRAREQRAAAARQEQAKKAAARKAQVAREQPAHQKKKGK